MSTNTVVRNTSVLIILIQLVVTFLHYDKSAFWLITVVHYYVEDIVGSCSPNLPHADIMWLSSNSFDQLMWPSCLSKNWHGISLASYTIMVFIKEV